MRIIDRYIIRLFLLNFVILLAVFMSLFVLGDSIIDLDRYLEGGRARAGEDGWLLFHTLIAIADFTGPILVMLYVFFCGLLVAAAAGFTFIALARSSEMIALLASGVSMYRLAMSVIVVGGLLNGVALLSQELIIPHLSDKLVRHKHRMKHTQPIYDPIRFVPDGSSALFTASEFAPDQQKLFGLTIIRRNAEGRAIEHIAASEGAWDAQRQGWALVDGQAVQPAGDDGVARIEPIDFFPSDLTPPILRARQRSLYASLLSFGTLQELERNEAVRNREEIRKIIHSRFSLFVMNTLVLVMGLPFFLIREPRNVLEQSVKAAGVCLGAWTLGLVIMQIGPTSMNPVLTAWLPVILYLPLSALLLQNIKT